jgi:peptidoglycan/xylan/chitin deacetylase (PgdA/CDA1 family)
MTALENGKLLAGSPDYKEIALTFDDGPKPGAIEPLVAELDRLGIKATFFLVGQQVKEFPELAKLIHDSGHEIASHSYTHPNLTKIPLDDAEKELVNADMELRAITGSPIIYWRPPGGNYNTQVLDRARKHKYVCVLWTINTADYLRPGKEKIERLVIDKATPGGIVLAHTGVQDTVDALEKIVKELTAQGYKFVTISEMASKMR